MSKKLILRLLHQHQLANMPKCYDRGKTNSAEQTPDYPTPAKASKYNVNQGREVVPFLPALLQVRDSPGGLKRLAC